MAEYQKIGTKNGEVEVDNEKIVDIFDLEDIEAYYKNIMDHYNNA